MQAVLTQINTMPGIVGSMLCDEDGRLAAHLFPSLFEVSMLEEAAGLLADSSLGLESSTGAVELIDLRYNDNRLVVRPMAKSFLLLLCNKAVNMQLLAISLNVATKKLERHYALCKPQQHSTAPARYDVTLPYPAVPLQLITVAVAGSKEKIKGVPLTVQAVKSTANTHWDNMFEMVAVNRVTASQISDCFDTGTFKKLKLTNPANGCSHKFRVRIIRDDAERVFEGKVVASLATMEKLMAKPGDRLVAQIEIGSGIFGWEGI